MILRGLKNEFENVIVKPELFLRIVFDLGIDFIFDMLLGPTVNIFVFFPQKNPTNEPKYRSHSY